MRAEQGFLQRLTTRGAPLVCAAALFTPFANPVEARPLAADKTPLQCLEYGGFSEKARSKVEICSSYITFSLFKSLGGYLKFGNSTNNVKSNNYRSSFEGFFYGQPRTQTEAQVRKLPKSPDSFLGNEVDIHDVEVGEPDVDLADNRAYVTVQQSVEVTRRNDRKILMPEKTTRRTITMCRIPGLALHRWVVVSYRPQPVDCNKLH